MKGAHLFKHGGAGTPEYNTWVLMKRRCHKQSSARYSEWGGRGIKVCAEWLNDFPAFLRHVGPRPSQDHSIDRIDNSRGYEPGNVRWATKIEQSNNRPGFCRRLQHNGRYWTLAELAREVGLNRECLKYRLDTGWPIDVAVATPSGVRP